MYLRPLTFSVKARFECLLYRLHPREIPNPLGGVARESNEFEPSIIHAAHWRGNLPQTHVGRYRAVPVCFVRPRAFARVYMHARANKRTRSACTRNDRARGCSHCEINEFFTMDTLTVAGRVSKSVPDALWQQCERYCERMSATINWIYCRTVAGVNLWRMQVVLQDSEIRIFVWILREIKYHIILRLSLLIVW